MLANQPLTGNFLEIQVKVAIALSKLKYQQLDAD
jgi:hypothetical protein